MADVERTPDGRYIVVDGRLWRAANPHLSPRDRERHTRELMAARRAVRSAGLADDGVALRKARARVHAAKVALGERGPVWWSDGAPDLNRRLVRNTPYAASESSDRDRTELDSPAGPAVPRSRPVA